MYREIKPFQLVGIKCPMKARLPYLFPKYRVIFKVSPIFIISKSIISDKSLTVLPSKKVLAKSLK